MNKIDLDDLPVFDEDYFARKNAEAAGPVNGENLTEYYQRINREKRLKKKAEKATKDAANTEKVEAQITSMSDWEINLEYERQGNYNDIMAFYEWFLFSEEIPEELRQEAIFFGGTVPYAALGIAPKSDGWNTRTFDDVDIFIQLKAFKKVRELLTKLKRFSMQDDSADMFIHHKTDDETDTFNDEVYNKLLHKDFGLKGSINVIAPFMNMMLQRNVNISLYPIFSENGSVCARGFRFGYSYRKSGDYLLDTMLAEDYSLDDFITTSNILGKKVNIVTPEYTIESKRIALSKEYGYRESKDEADVNFMIEHAEELEVDSEKRLVLERKIPYIGVQTAYKIWNGRVVNELNGHDYVEAVKYVRSSFS